MRAHGKGSEGSEKRGGANKKGGAKKGGVRRTPLFSKRGVHAAQAPPLNTPMDVQIDR